AASTTVVTWEAGPYTYRGTAFTATASVTGAGGLNQALTIVYSGECTNVSTANGCTATASFGGDANHEASSDSKSITIGKADAVISVTGYSGSYDGAAHGASGSALGVETPTPADLTSLLHLGATFSDVPGGTAHWTFDGNTNYNPASGDAAITIAKAASTTTVTGGSFPYDGTAHPATVVVTGAGGLNLTPSPSYSGSCSAAPVTVAQGASCTASYSFAGNANHNASSGSAAITITQAPVKVLVGSASVAYTGTAQTVSLTVTPSSASSVVVLTYTWASPSYNSTTGPTHTGTYTATASLSDSTNYAFTGDSVNPGTLTITAAPVTVTISGSAIYDGNPHAATVATSPSGVLTSVHYTGTGTASPVTQTITINPARVQTILSNTNGTYPASAFGQTIALQAQVTDIDHNVALSSGHVEINAFCRLKDEDTATGPCSPAVLLDVTPMSWNGDTL